MDATNRGTFDKPAFAELSTNNGSLMVWVNRTLLPDIANLLEMSSNPELLDFCRACTEVYRREKKSSKNDSCAIAAEERQSRAGARITFHSNVAVEVIRNLINTTNRAIAKIGYEWRNSIGWQGERREIRWRRQDYFLCGVNVPAQAATLTLNRSALLELVRLLPEHPLREKFEQLAGILDVENQDVDEELDENLAAMDESLMKAQE